MATREHVSLLRKGVPAWNRWRQEHLTVTPDLFAADLRQLDLSGAQLTSADLRQANFTFANLTGANLIRSNLEEANITWANLTGVNLTQANLRSASLFKCGLHDAVLQGANLSTSLLVMCSLKRANLDRANLHGANLTESGLVDATARECVFRHARLLGSSLVGADFSGSDFTHADLTLADLTNADLSGARLSNAILTGALLNGARVVGVAGWDADLHATQQRDLVVTPKERTRLTVDGLDAAQFVLLLLQHARLRELAHPVRSTAVLVVGDFAADRSAVRDALAETLRQQGYTPVSLYVESPTADDLGSLIRSVLPVVRFACVDLTGPVILRSLIEELSWGGVPVQPLVHGLTENIRLELRSSSRRVLPLYPYENTSDLQAALLTTLIPRIKTLL